jgi:hypothetical protein
MEPALPPDLSGRFAAVMGLFRSLPARLLLRLSHAIFNHRRWFFYPQAVLFLVCVLYTTKHLEFNTERSALVGAEKEYHQHYLRYKAEFPVQDDLVVVVESESLEKNRQFVERLGAKLEAETNLFAGVFYKGDLKMMGRKALLFLPEDSLRDLRQTLQDYLPFLRQFTRATNLESLFDLVNTQIRRAKRGTNAENQSLVKALPALERIVALATDALERAGTPPSPGVTALFEGGAEAARRQYITFGDGRIYLVTAQAKNQKLRERALERLRELVAETQQEVTGLNVGLTGEPILEYDEMAQSQKDTTLATIVSLVLVALIFIFGYHETGRPLKATVCLLVGLGYTMGFTTLVVGHLNILTIAFVPILIGLAIDFGVHLITRYEEELRHGRPEHLALDRALVNTGLGIFTGAFTTAGAFFAMMLTDFDGIREMGLICGGGMLVCLVPMMTLLPVLLLRGRQNILDHELGPILESQAAIEVDRRARIENIWLRRPVTVAVVIGALGLLAIPSARQVKFDYNLLSLKSAGLPAVVFQDKLIDSSRRSVLFGVIIANSPEEAVRLTSVITNLPTVETVESMGPYLSGYPTAKLALVRAVKEVVAKLDFAPVDRRPVNVTGLMQSLWSLHGYLGLATKEVAAEAGQDPKLHRQLESLRGAIGALLSRLRIDDRILVAGKLGEYQGALFDDVRKTFDAIRSQDDQERLQVSDLPETLRRRFIGVTGKLILQVYPKKNVWERGAQEEFVRQLRQVDKRATGTPVEILEYTTLLKVSYEEAALYSLIAIAILVFIHFRRISCVVLALIPVGVGALWLMGLMGVFGIPFNPANIMTLPLIVGIGVTNGIHILNRFAEEEHPSILARSTGKAVLVSGLTTITGFGSLILAEHRGIRSLGWIMSIGVAACMLVGLTLLPAILNLLDRHGWRIKKNPARQCTIDAGSGGTEVKTSDTVIIDQRATMSNSMLKRPL